MVQQPLGKIVRLLDEETLRAVHRAAVAVGLNREALLAGIDNSFRASIPEGANLAAKLLLDLNHLNEVVLTDANEPHILTWLKNAEALARGSVRCLHPRVATGATRPQQRRLARQRREAGVR